MESSSHLFPKVALWIGRVGGAMIVALTLFVVFAVKPLPAIEINLSSADESQCIFGHPQYSDEYSHLANETSLDELVAMDGQVVFITLKLSTDISSDGPNLPTSGFGCVLGLQNLAEPIGGGMWGLIDTNQFFEVVTQVVVTLKDSDYEYEATVDLLLPSESGDFHRTSVCEKYCYALSGPMRIQSGFSSEGIAGFKLLPVNVYQNSYLTKRYECRRKVHNQLPAWIAPIACALF
ncbi:hypothetical protein OAN307_c39740 [Octadecabacter antarcticus 307]|uniref:Uncharacterized protein n=1 Tax=Octadecabacter antarcticus 307 TaxID=391626 RepID=M9RB22_9RHOB|nr:hypothetical protein [Octadecabacter antarcticus]AGI69402.1 hypothetical protein OAN307_c39740 [Octadecabacter antarcticus 307]